MCYDISPNLTQEEVALPLKLPYAWRTRSRFLPPSAQSPVCLLSALGNMDRITARLLLAVLLVGIFSPFAAALSIETPKLHCNRKAAPAAPADGMPGCHRHAGPAAHHPEAAKTSPADQILDSSQCCCDHECCRSTARSPWAQTGLQGRTRALELAAALISASLIPVRSFDLALSRSVRAPPLL